MKSMIMKAALLASAALAVGAIAPSASAQALNISLDGFCNTFALTVDSFGIYGTRGGCGYTDIDGGTVGKVGATYYITNDTNDSAEIFTWYFTKPKHKAGNWYLYEETATTFGEVNSGTYTEAKAGAQRGGKDATSKEGRTVHPELPVSP